MVFSFVAVLTEKDDKGVVVDESIVSEGNIVAKSKDHALLQIGAMLAGEELGKIEVSVKPF